MSTLTKTSTYRQRGYKNQDTGEIVIVYSSDPAPSEGHWVVEWDNQVTVTETITPTQMSGAI